MVSPGPAGLRTGDVIWLMGPTSSGKTTIADELLGRLLEAGVPALHYDGDEVRGFFGDGYGFAPEDRLRVVGTLVHLADKASQAGVTVIVSALTANEDARRLVRDGIDGLVVVSVRCSIEVCAARDPKGLYEQARKGEIQTLIGFNAPYPEPENPDVVIDTESLSPDQAAQAIFGHLRDKGFPPTA